MSNVSITGYAGWLAYDMFLIVSFSSQPVYDPNPLKPNSNPKKPVSGLCRIRRFGRTLTPLTPRIHFFFFFFLLHHDVFVSSVLLFFNFFFKKIHYTLRVFFFLEKVEILNYNNCKLLIFTQKIDEPLSTCVSACSKASILLCVNFEFLTTELHVFYILNIYVKFCSTHMLFTIWSINLFLYIIT